MTGKIFIAVVLAALLGYGALEARHLIAGPVISLTVPTNYTSSTGFIEVSGTAHNTESLTVNGALLPIDEEGRFKDELALPKGGAILSFTARDRFGRTTTLTRTIYLP
jgi:hypothetical protein